MLEHLKRKIEAGEALTEPELAELERQSRLGEDPRLSLAVAHALSNAGHDAEALRLFRARSAAGPQDVETLLGCARALTGLERYADAERSLQAALSLRPDDPEALKALALLALRKGESARAEWAIGSALERDPFDGEARLIREELHASEGESPHSHRDAARAQLLAHVRPVLRAEGFRTEAPSAARTEGPAGLDVFYVLADARWVRYVPVSVLEELDVSVDALSAAAFDALERDPEEPRRTTRGINLLALARGDGLGSARLLCASQRALLPSHAPLAVRFPSKELTLLWLEGDPNAEKLGQELTSSTAAGQGIPGAFRWSAGALTRA